VIRVAYNKTYYSMLLHSNLSVWSNEDVFIMNTFE